MKILIFLTIFFNFLTYNTFSIESDLKVYNTNHKELVKNSKSYKIRKIIQEDKLEEKNLSDKKLAKTKKVRNKKIYLDYLWILILPFFILLYFVLTKIAERFLFMPFDPYEKYMNSLNSLLRKNKKNKYKVIAILQNFKNYLQEKMGIGNNFSNEELLIKLEKLGIERKAIIDILNKMDEIKHPSYNLKDEDVNELLDSIENIILEIEQKHEES